MVSSKKIIALHGAGMNGGAWDAVKDHLACETLSFPGHGETPGPFLTSIESMASWTVLQMDKHAPQSVVLMGHSMGALVALAAAHHAAVAGLVLIGVTAQMPVNTDLLKQAKDDPVAAAGLILKWGVSRDNPAAKEILKKYMQPEALFNDLSACHAYKDAVMTRKPVLVLAGTDDKLIKMEDSRDMAHKLTAGKFHSFSGAGHMLMVEKPLEISWEIKAFVSGLEG